MAFRGFCIWTLQIQNMHSYLMKWSSLSIYCNEWKTRIFDFSPMHCGILFSHCRRCWLRTRPKRHLWRQNNNAVTAWCLKMLSRKTAHRVCIWNRANMSACTPTTALTVAISVFCDESMCKQYVLYIWLCVGELFLFRILCRATLNPVSAEKLMKKCSYSTSDCFINLEWQWSH